MAIQRTDGSEVNCDWKDLDHWIDQTMWIEAAINRREERIPTWNSWDVRMAHEDDRCVLVWALETYPARTMEGIFVKAKAATTLPRRMMQGVVDAILRDLSAVAESPAPGAAA